MTCFGDHGAKSQRVRSQPLNGAILKRLCKWLGTCVGQQSMREPGLSRPKFMRPSPWIGLVGVGLSLWCFVSPALAEGSKAQGKGNDHLHELLYINAEVGAEYVGFQQLHITRELFPTTIHTVDVGPAVGVGAGVRLFFLTLGPRFRYGVFRDWDLWSLDAELGLRIPLGSVEPWAMVGGGYSRLGRMRERSVQVQGYNIRVGFGLDYYFNKMFSLGGGVSGDVLGMTRPGVDLNQATGSVSEDIYKLDGSSLGIALQGSAVVGFHL